MYFLYTIVIGWCVTTNALSSEPRFAKETTTSGSRRFFVGAIVAVPAVVAPTFWCPEIAAADAPAVLYPGGGGPSLVRPPYEVGSWAPSAPLTTKLGNQRILAKQLSPLNQIALPFSEQELYYPSFLFGSWKLTATLKSKR